MHTLTAPGAATYDAAPTAPSGPTTAAPTDEVLRRLTRWGAAPLAVGSIANGIHLAVVDGRLVGAHHMVGTPWAVAHTLHVVAATLFLVATLGLWAGQARASGRLGVAALVSGLVGSGLFLALGVFTAFVIPIMVRHTPALGEASGPFFDPPFWFVGVGIVGYSIGWLLTAWATARARVYPRPLAALLAAGALLQGIPPRPFGPAPWALIEAGGVLMAVAGCGLGWAMWKRTSP